MKDAIIFTDEQRTKIKEIVQDVLKVFAPITIEGRVKEWVEREIDELEVLINKDRLKENIKGSASAYPPYKLEYQGKIFNLDYLLPFRVENTLTIPTKELLEYIKKQPQEPSDV